MDRESGNIVTTITIRKDLYIKLRKHLLEVGKSFSKWVREKIEEDTRKDK